VFETSKITELPVADKTVILLGPGDDGREVVWTFHPGDPVAPSIVPVESSTLTVLTVARAKALGFALAKIRLKAP
jgi:hypothetical protein